ncbi:MAG TPA: hypothetical protein VF624_09825 [Tepidisphaeraceae bacterium]|jgi:hypothetical protein
MATFDSLQGDVLSDKARAVLRIEPHAAFTDLVPRRPGSAEAGEILHALSPADLLGQPVRGPDDAACLLAGLWLWHGYLDESHAVSQGIETPSGSYFHAIMHRMEGDFGNAKYWYARVGKHPVLPVIGASARDIVARAPLDKAALRLTLGDWSGPAFVDYVQSLHESPSDERYAVAVALQQLEWRALFDHCTRVAVDG